MGARYQMMLPKDKARNIACIVWMEDLEKLYGDKAYAMLVGFLAGLHVECACSPVHDRDKYTAEDVRRWCRRHEDPDTGEVLPDAVVPALGRAPRVGDPKKPHVHCMFKLPGPKTAAYMSDLMSDLVAVSDRKWMKVEAWPVMLRYLAHLDNDEKAQYSMLDVKGFGGIDMSALLKTSVVDKVQLVEQVTEAIEDCDIRSFWQLNRWARSTQDMDILNVVQSRPTYFGLLIRGRNDDRRDDKSEARKKQLVSFDGHLHTREEVEDGFKRYMEMLFELDESTGDDGDE